jgi:hypothetical protein
MIFMSQIDKPIIEEDIRLCNVPGDYTHMSHESDVAWPKIVAFLPQPNIISIAHQIIPAFEINI